MAKRATCAIGVGAHAAASSCFLLRPALRAWHVVPRTQATRSVLPPYTNMTGEKAVTRDSEGLARRYGACRGELLLFLLYMACVVVAMSQQARAVRELSVADRSPAVGKPPAPAGEKCAAAVSHAFHLFLSWRTDCLLATATTACCAPVCREWHR